ncbi:amidohydrolase family protein [Streptomyces corynorhini]|uniref:amidohydrolase family protein n=1 Tax=Streptomyces corynorhini TaxID=2282652 RepID=UPI0018F549DA
MTLVAATRVNAEILRLGHETGTIGVGRLADLTVWSTGPLADPDVFGDPEQAECVTEGGELVSVRRMRG